MSFNRKITDNNDIKTNYSKNSELYKDDLNIKAYLNSSLEQKGVSVSEDLIQRTLKAVKESEIIISDSDKDERINLYNKKEENQITKKLIPWHRYIRIAAGAAAAVIVVVAGLNFYNDVGKKDMDYVNMDIAKNAESSIAQNDRADNATESDNTGGSLQYNAKADSSQDSGTKDNKTSTNQDQNKQSKLEKPKEDATKDAVKDATKEDASDHLTASEDSSDTDDNNSIFESILSKEDDQTDTKGVLKDKEKDFKEFADATNDKNGISSIQKVPSILQNPNLTFQEITAADSKKVQRITITNEADHTKIILPYQETINHFYTIMNQQQYVEGPEASSTIYYTVVATSNETNKKLFIMKIGDSITVRRISGDSYHTKIYNAMDEAKLIESLKKLFQQYSK